MAKIMEMEILEICLLGGPFKFIFKMICGDPPSQTIEKNIDTSWDRDRFKYPPGSWRKGNRPWSFLLCFFQGKKGFI